MTKTQAHVLQVMADGGGPLHKMRGLSCSCFLSRNMETVRWVTADVLEKLGYIEDYEDLAMRWRGSKYQLTEAGMQAWERYRDTALRPVVEGEAAR